MRNPKFSIFLDKAGEFRFNLKAKNGQVILQSEGYKSRAGCKNGIESVKKNSSKESAFYRDRSKNNQDYFVLRASNKEPIGRSEMYRSKAAMENGIASVRRVAAEAQVEDLTLLN